MNCSAGWFKMKSGKRMKYLNNVSGSPKKFYFSHYAEYFCFNHKIWYVFIIKKFYTLLFSDLIVQVIWSYYLDSLLNGNLLYIRMFLSLKYFWYYCWSPQLFLFKVFMSIPRGSSSACLWFSESSNIDPRKFVLIVTTAASPLYISKWPKWIHGIPLHSLCFFFTLLSSAFCQRSPAAAAFIRVKGARKVRVQFSALANDKCSSFSGENNSVTLATA